MCIKHRQGRQPLFSPGQCVSGFGARSSLKQGHSEQFTFLFKQVGCLSFVSALFQLTSCQSLSLEMWQFSKDGGMRRLSEVTTQNERQPALLKLLCEVSNRGGFWARGKVVSCIAYWGEISRWFYLEGFFWCVFFNECAMLLTACSI